MTQLSEEKLNRLEGFLATLPGALVDRICSVAEQADPSLARLLMLCRQGVDACARERFFAPLAPVSGDPEQDRPSRALTPEALQIVLWTWLKDTLAPDIAAEASATVSDAEAEGSPGKLDQARIKAAALILDAVEAAEAEPKAAKKLRARLGVDDFDAVRRAAVILRTSPELRRALEGLPAKIPDMSDALSAAIRDRYEAASEADPDAAIWVLYLMMARMDKPWKLLRVFERIARREDDLLVSQTDMAVIGEALLADAEHVIKGFADPPQTEGEARAAAQALADFAAITVGMTREIGIRKDGEWGKRLFEVRSRASDQMARIHEAAQEAFKLATPEGGGLRVRVKTPPGPGEPGFERASALGVFLILTKDDAGRAAVGNAHAEAISAIRERLEAVSQKYLNSLRGAQAEEVDNARIRLGEVAQLMESVGEKEAAAVLLRRVAAARAA